MDYVLPAQLQLISAIKVAPCRAGRRTRSSVHLSSLQSESYYSSHCGGLRVRGNMVNALELSSSFLSSRRLESRVRVRVPIRDESQSQIGGIWLEGSLSLPLVSRSCLPSSPSFPLSQPLSRFVSLSSFFFQSIFMPMKGEEEEAEEERGDNNSGSIPYSNFHTCRRRVERESN